MTDRITRQVVLARLEENQIPYGLLDLQAGWSAVISQRGGRILGPFPSPVSEGLFWINDAWADSDAFRRFLDSGNWNLGGDRVWIAPEIQYSVRDRQDYWGTIAQPPQIDPGNYTLQQAGAREWKLSESMDLQAYNLATGLKHLRLERTIRPAPDPLRNLGAYARLTDGVTYLGYEQVVTLAESRLDEIMSEAWDLVQLNPGGELLIPASPAVEVTDYYAPVDADHLHRHPNHIRLKLSGRRQYKVGIKAAQTLGRLGYYCPMGDTQAYLVVRNYFNNPSVPYTEEPDFPVGCRGHSIHVYNDGGQFGGFGEMEVNLPTIGGETGRSSSTDHLLLWIYIGVQEQVRRIAYHLLGIEI
jgi:hypothetical protein